MEIKQILNRIKIWIQRIITGGKQRPKLPRKKIQIQYQEVRSQFEKHVHMLETVLQDPEIYPSTVRLGNEILKEVNRFQELNLPSINENRLEKIINPLLHPADISLWTIYQMHSYTEEIFHFIKTMEVISL